MGATADGVEDHLPAQGVHGVRRAGVRGFAYASVVQLVPVDAVDDGRVKRERPGVEERHVAVQPGGHDGGIVALDIVVESAVEVCCHVLACVGGVHGRHHYAREVVRLVRRACVDTAAWMIE